MKRIPLLVVFGLLAAAPSSSEEDRLAFLSAPDALYDADAKTVIVKDEKTVVGLDAATGKTRWSLDLGAAVGPLWPAGPYLAVGLPATFPQVSFAAVDPGTHKETARCTGTLEVRPTSGQASWETYSFRGTPYLRYEATMPPDPPRGARMTDAEMEDWTRRFADGYACGVMKVSVDGDSCTLTSIEPKRAGLKSCGERVLPDRRNLGWPIQLGDLFLQVHYGRGDHTQRTILKVVRVVDEEQKEVWSRELSVQQVLDPPPMQRR